MMRSTVMPGDGRELAHVLNMSRIERKNMLDEGIEAVIDTVRTAIMTEMTDMSDHERTDTFMAAAAAMVVVVTQKRTLCVTMVIGADGALVRGLQGQTRKVAMSVTGHTGDRNLEIRSEIKVAPKISPENMPILLILPRARRSVKPVPHCLYQIPTP